MKDLSYSAMLGISVGLYLGRFIRGAWYWDIWTWLVVLAMSAYIYAIWKFDNRGEE